MSSNIEWASPEVIECWSYQGRLYQSLKKAEYERNCRIKGLTQTLEVNRKAGRDIEWLERLLENIPAIYKVTWAWSKLDV